MNEQETLQAFLCSMHSIAEEDLARLEAEIASVREEQRQHDQAIAEAGEDQCIREARQRAVRMLREEAARTAAEGRHQLLRLRETLAEDIFAQAREALCTFAASASYADYFTGCVRALRAQLPQADAVLLVRAQDQALAAAWQGAVQADGTIQIGGARAESRSAALRADETLDVRLAEQWDWFRAHAGAAIPEGGESL